MRKMRKLLSAILALLLVMGLSPAMTAKADSTFAFTLQPANGTADKSESCTFKWALNETPDSIELESFSPSGTGWGSIKALPCVAGTTSDAVSYISWYHLPSGSTYRIRATKGSDTIYSDEFEVVWTGNDPSEEPLTLDRIEITTAPDTTEYTAGQTFDPTGMVITAYYFDSGDLNGAVVTKYTVSPAGGLATTDTSVTISYTEGNITKTVTQAITVSAAATKTLNSIAITTAPTTTTYTAGQGFDPAGMVVTATYSDNTTAEVSGYKVSPYGALATTDTYVTISYTEGNITKTALQSITVIANASKTLSSIAITAEPNRTTYWPTQKFDPTGMVVTATYSDNSTTEVTDYSISPSRVLTSTDTSVTISYTEDNITKTATQEITVVSLSSISITTEPSTTTYTAGQSFDTKGMVVTATYSDNSSKVVEFYTYSPSGALSTADTSVTISYTEDDVTKTATQAITVIPAGTAEFGFTLQPADGTADKSESCTFKWALNETPDSIELESFSPSGTGWGSIKALPCVAGTTSDAVSYISWYHLPSGSTYRIRATKGSDTIYSDEFEVVWTGNDPSEEPLTLDRIEITTAPDTTEYTAGQTFDPTGMVITAYYFDSGDLNGAVVTKYTVSPAGGLATTDTSVTISYTEGNITKTTTQKITVNPGTNSFKITFDANGHGTAPAAQTVGSGKTATKPSDPTASGWTFGGWYTEATCANAFDFSKAIASDFTLYAKWTENKASEETTYIVTVGANGSVTQGNDMTITVKRSVADDTCFSHFTGVQIDGKACAAGDYDAKAGSTVVTLKAATIENLSTGAHTITVLFDDGKAETKVTVEAKASEETDPTENEGTGEAGNSDGNGKVQSPKTGDDRTDFFWVLLVLTALCACGVVLMNGKCRNTGA